VCVVPRRDSGYAERCGMGAVRLRRRGERSGNLTSVTGGLGTWNQFWGEVCRERNKDGWIVWASY
jgi:hypothetical protein